MACYMSIGTCISSDTLERARSQSKIYLRLRWLVGCFGLMALRESIYVGPSPKRKGEREEKGQMRVKMSKQPPPAPTANAVGPCPTVSQMLGCPGTESLPCTIAPPDHPLQEFERR